MIATAYEYPIDGQRTRTVAVLPKGCVGIDKQYGTVTRTRSASPDVLEGIDTQALLAEAREHGKFGWEPEEPRASEPTMPSSSACPRCHSYCHGDCEI